MKIVDLRATPVYVPMHHPLRWSFGVEPGMTRVIVELVTDDGLIGLGESNGGAQLAAAIMEAKPLVIGLDPLEVSRLAKRFAVYRITSEQLARAAQFKLAGAAIEMACWDLVGKILGKRCADLWGGPSASRSSSPPTSSTATRRSRRRAAIAIHSSLPSTRSSGAGRTASVM